MKTIICLLLLVSLVSCSQIEHVEIELDNYELNGGGNE